MTEKFIVDRFLIDKEAVNMIKPEALDDLMAELTPENVIKSLSYEQKDKLYRTIWLERVKEDIVSYLDENSEKYSFMEDEAEKQCAIETAADRYVFQGEYDCNLGYWTNIQNLLDEIDDAE